MRLTLIALMFVAAGWMAACESKPADDGTTSAEGETTEAVESDENAEGGEAETNEGSAEVEMVAVAKDGTKFDPPVEKSQIPAGAWICDMGKVEYARMEKGDGKCPVCGMMLKQHGEAPAEGGDEDGHDHGDGADHEH